MKYHRYLSKYFSIVIFFILTWSSVLCARESNDTLSVSLLFMQDKTELDLSYLENKYNLNLFIEEAQALLSKYGEMPQEVTIQAFASPEGPFNHNMDLSAGRAKTLVDYISQQLNLPVSIFKLDPRGEDWQGFRRYVNDHDFQGKEEVARVIGKYTEYIDGRPISEIGGPKKELMELNGGKTWNWMLDNVFPNLRRSEFKTIFKMKREEVMLCDVSNEIIPVKDTLICEIPFYIKPTIKTLPEEQRHRREILSVKTNLAQYCIILPNLGYAPVENIALEYYPRRGHFTFGLQVDCAWRKRETEHYYFQLRQWELYSRFYFKRDEVFRRLYLKLYANTSIYGIGYDAVNGVQGEGVGAGIGIGYVLPLTREGHLRLEFEAQAGCFYTRYDPYVYGCPADGIDDGRYFYKYYGDPQDFVKRRMGYKYLGPTRISINLSYDIIYKKW